MSHGAIKAPWPGRLLRVAEGLSQQCCVKFSLVKMLSQEKAGGDKPLPYEKKIVGATLVVARKTVDFSAIGGSVLRRPRG